MTNLRKVELKPSNTKLVAAKKQPILKAALVQISLRIRPRQYIHSFHVLEQAEAGYLLRLDFSNASELLYVVFLEYTASR